MRAGPDPLTALHRVIDATLACFGDRADFRRMLIELRGGRAIIGPALAGWSDLDPSAPDFHAFVDGALRPPDWSRLLSGTSPAQPHDAFGRPHDALGR